MSNDYPHQPVAPVTWALAIITLVFYLATANGYGYFRDELYYLANGQHLAFGYVDHPPLIGVIAALSRALFGESLVSLRLLPSVAAALTVLLTGAMAARLGGGAFAQAVAALCAMTAPIYLALFTILSMNAFDVLFWSLAFWMVTKLLLGGDQRMWLLFGLIAGIGLQNKTSMVFLGAGLVVALLIAGRRDVFRTPWFWLGGLLASLLFVPFLWWQAAHGWPLIEFMANARRDKNVAFSPLQFLAAQALETAGPIVWTVAMCGLGWLLVSRHAARVRALGWTYPIIFAAMVAAGGAKPYYLAPAYTVLLAAGGVALGSWTSRWPGPARVVVITVIVIAGAIVAPLAKPLLPVETYVRYAAALGQEPSTDERHELGRLPQFFADMHGWPELAATVGRVYRSLPPEDRSRACVFGQNYGEAGAIDFFGARDGLPRAVSGHNSYYLWGPGECTGEVMIVIGDDLESLARLCRYVERAATFTCADCMPYENNQPIWITRGLRQAISEIWPRLKHYE